MRISYWSSDVCSSDLLALRAGDDLLGHFVGDCGRRAPFARRPLEQLADSGRDLRNPQFDVAFVLAQIFGRYVDDNARVDDIIGALSAAALEIHRESSRERGCASV